MLVLTRRIGENIIIGDDIVVTLCKIRGGQVAIGVTAPDHVNIVREELLPADFEMPEIDSISGLNRQ